MTAVKAGGLCCERLGNCSLRCSRQLLLHCSTFAHPWARTSCIHAVVKGAMENREPPEGGTHHSFPLKGGRWGWGGNVSACASASALHPPPPPPPPPPPRGGEGPPRGTE